MAVDIHKLIAAISPDTYCANWDTPSESSPRREVKKMIAEELSKIKKSIEEKRQKAKKEGKIFKVSESDVKTDIYVKASEKAKLVESDYIDVMDMRFNKNPFDAKALANPIERHTLSYDVFSQTLEPIYFWILDHINANYKSSDKLIDNFVSSAGSGHFAEMSGRKTRMQEEGMKMLGQINTVLRSVLNIMYDLKEFRMRLADYDNYRKSTTKEAKSAALLSLKQIWMDQVDFAKRGNSSIKAMAQQFDYVTLIDGFMSADTLDKVTNSPEKGGLDLNERVRRILQQRLQEFFRWLDESESELKKRFEIEKAYLKSQVNSLKLYARWAKPYLLAATKLEGTAKETADIVTSFNTAVFQLTLMGVSPYAVDGDVAQGDLPKYFLKMQQKDQMRKCNSIIIVEFKFRSVPDRTDQRGGYGFRGKVDITFTSYAINEEELKILKQLIDKDNLGDVMSLIGGATTDSIGTIQSDIDDLLGEKKSDKDDKVIPADDNPFSALFSLFSSSSDKAAPKEPKVGIASDTPEEKIIRSQTVLASRWSARKAYLDFKKSLDLPALPPVFRGPL